MKPKLCGLVFLMGWLICACSAQILAPVVQTKTEEITMNEIEQVVFIAKAGPILPELQWHEEIIITRTDVVLHRSGSVENSHINVGVWDITVEISDITRLFDQLHSVDCSTIKKIEPLDLPDGGETEIFTIYYKNGETCSLSCEPGIRYEHEALVKEPIKKFIQSLKMSMMAESRYVFR